MRAINVGFTGTRQGMTNYQKHQLREFLHLYRGGTFRHGDCIGADAEAQAIALGIGYDTVAYPSVLESQRAFTRGNVMVLPPKPPLVRNHWIVEVVEKLIACPSSIQEEVRSGTWATVRWARKRAVPVLIIYPESQGDEHDDRIR